MGTKKALEMERKLNLLWIRELEIVIRKYKKKIEYSSRKKTELETNFNTLEEVQEAYGYGEINTEEYETLCDFFVGVDKVETLDGLFLGNLEKELAVYRSSLKDIEDLLKDRKEKNVRATDFV